MPQYVALLVKFVPTLVGLELLFVYLFTHFGRGPTMQGEAASLTQFQGQVIGILCLAVGTLISLAYKGLTKQIKSTNNNIQRTDKRLQILTDAIFIVEAKLHPDHADIIIAAMRQVLNQNAAVSSNGTNGNNQTVV